MAVALLTTYLAPYRVPLFERLAEREGVEVLCFGGGERYVPPWFADLDAQLRAAPFPARRISGPLQVARAARDHEAVIAPFAGGALLPTAYAAARRAERPFVLWASVWAQPRSGAHTVARPAIRHIYRHAGAVVAYGEHVRRFVAGIRGRDDDVFVAPQSVEPEIFGRRVREAERRQFRLDHSLGQAAIVLYVGRLVPEKGVDVLLDAFAEGSSERGSRLRSATLVLIGDGPLAERARATEGVRLLGPMPRSELPVAYSAATLAVLPSVPTPRFREPWGLVCNEAMHAGCPVVASDAVGAVAGGLVRDGSTGLVVPAGDAAALREAIGRLLRGAELRSRLAAAGREAVRAYSYDAMADAFTRALRVARGR